MMASYSSGTLFFIETFESGMLEAMEEPSE